MTTEKTAANGKAPQTANQAPAQPEATITVLKKENPYGQGTVRWARHAIIVKSKTVAEATAAIKKEGLSVGSGFRKAVEKGLISISKNA